MTTETRELLQVALSEIGEEAAFDPNVKTAAFLLGIGPLFTIWVFHLFHSFPLLPHHMSIIWLVGLAVIWALVEILMYAWQQAVMDTAIQRKTLTLQQAMQFHSDPV